MKNLAWAGSILLAAATFAVPAAAQEVLPAGPLLTTPQTKTTTLRATAEIPPGLEPAAQKKHPLEAALKFALRAYEYAQQNVRDYNCLLVKRERIEGDLLDLQYIRAQVRTGGSAAGSSGEPYSVFLEFLAPTKIKGRKVLYVEGRNDSKMLVRNGGKRFNYVTVKVDPNSDAAMSESLVPITQIGFANVTDSLIKLIRQDIERDPAGTNTKVKFYRRAKINGRVCTRISVLHATPDPVLEFAEANAFVDDELHVPIRVEALLWPKSAGGAKPLLFEYTYTDLRLNVGLTDADFRTSLLDGK